MCKHNRVRYLIKYNNNNLQNVFYKLNVTVQYIYSKMSHNIVLYSGSQRLRIRIHKLGIQAAKSRGIAIDDD